MQTENDISFPKIIIDASIAVKWFAFEQGTPEARALLKKASEGTVLLYAPDLLLYEVANALGKGKRLAKQAIDLSLETLWDKVKLEALEQRLAKTAINFMLDYDLSYYDAVYVALAYGLEIPLLSSDLKAHKNIKGITTLTLNDF